MSQRLVLQSIIATGAIVFFGFYKLSGCFDRTPASGLPTVKMQIGNKSFELEVANTEDARHTGLMQRDSMPSDHGMIFTFHDERGWSFYMKNTRIPLDIIFADANGRVVSIQQMKPYDLTTISPEVPVKYAIELNKGAAAKAGAKVGDKLSIPNSAKEAKE